MAVPFAKLTTQKSVVLTSKIDQLFTVIGIIGQDAFELHKQLCEVLQFRQDYCVIDVYLSAIEFMQGAGAKPWWFYTKQRKAEMK